MPPTKDLLFSFPAVLAKRKAKLRFFVGEPEFAFSE